MVRYVLISLFVLALFGCAHDDTLSNEDAADNFWSVPPLGE